MAFDLRRWAARQGAPFTLFLLASLVAFALLGWLTQGRAVVPLALIDPVGHPWSFLTYPWAYNPLAESFGVVFLLFFVMWLVQFGTSVEREMGTARFIAFWLVSTLVPALVAFALGLGLAEPWLPTSAVVVAWCARNRSSTVGFWGFPLSATVLAGIVAAMVLFSYGRANPLFGVLMAAPLAMAWLFGADRLPLRYAAAAVRRRDEPVVRGGTKYDEGYFDEVKDRERERDERERLRRLFEGK